MSQLDIVERALIYEHRCLSKSFGFIAKALNRPKSTVTREFKRNQVCPHGYETVRAQEQRDKRAKKPRKAKKFSDKRVVNFVVSKQKESLSPVQIAGLMKLEKNLGNYDAPTVSHEAIYQFIYKDKSQGGTLYKYLRRKRRKRKSRLKNKRIREIIKNRKGIEERPAIVEKKSRFGDLEADLIVGSNHEGAILTLVDRHSKFLWAKFIESKSQKDTELAFKKLLKQYKGKIHTITSDNGKEFACHQEVANFTQADFFFADPYSSWQRGLNEHTNGLIREFFPKKTIFNRQNLIALPQIVSKINNRPRKVLGFKTPRQIHYEITGIKNA